MPSALTSLLSLVIKRPDFVHMNREDFFLKFDCIHRLQTSSYTFLYRSEFRSAGNSQRSYRFDRFFSRVQTKTNMFRQPGTFGS